MYAIRSYYDGRHARLLLQGGGQMCFELLALLLGDVAGQVVLPVERHPGLHRGGVEVIRVVQHQVDLERLVEVVRVTHAVV